MPGFGGTRPAGWLQPRPPVATGGNRERGHGIYLSVASSPSHDHDDVGHSPSARPGVECSPFYGTDPAKAPTGTAAIAQRPTFSQFREVYITFCRRYPQCWPAKTRPSGRQSPRSRITESDGLLIAPTENRICPGATRSPSRADQWVNTRQDPPNQGVENGGLPTFATRHPIERFITLREEVAPTHPTASFPAPPGHLFRTREKEVSGPPFGYPSPSEEAADASPGGGLRTVFPTCAGGTGR